MQMPGERELCGPALNTGKACGLQFSFDPSQPALMALPALYREPAKSKAALIARPVSSLSTERPELPYSTFPVIDATFSSLMALVIWMSRGQAMVQL
jgi:hypothetical protein